MHLDSPLRESLEHKCVCSEPCDSTGGLSFCHLSDSLTAFKATWPQLCTSWVHCGASWEQLHRAEGSPCPFLTEEHCPKQSSS